MRGDNDNPEKGEKQDFRASRLAVFLPTLVIAIGSCALLVLLGFSGKWGTVPAWLCLAMLTMVPALAVHALLRALTTRVMLLRDAVRIERGFPSSRGVDIPYALIKGMRVTQRPAIRPRRRGTLVFMLADGTKVAVPDLFDADRAIAAIRGLAEENLATVAMPARSARPCDEESAIVG
ncbi:MULTISPECIES: PH domain-containing protein [unclassified Mesorhizobium]|uniref:PH domain-containing protein n=1 Tax=unclassified Mesorhizobium TaxID=325217 RepID=UPI001926B361|nr:MULTISPECIES: PH domain-containing protein [unclassified Mesorhizobium]